MDFYVYVHRRATDGKVFYVGKGYKKRAWSIHSRNIHWQRTVAKHGYTVEIVQSGMQEWWSFEFECELIAFYGRENLVNLTDGGDGSSGYIPSIESIEKAAKANRGRKKSQESINKTSAAHRGMKRSEESRKRMSEAQKSKNYKASDLTRLRMSIVKRYSPLPEDFGIKVSAALKGVKKSETHRKAISIARIGMKLSEKARKTMSDNRKGKPVPRHVIESMRISRMVAIKCSNGMIFESMTAAVLWLKETSHPKANTGEISQCINNPRRKTSYGYKWEKNVNS